MNVFDDLKFRLQQNSAINRLIVANLAVFIVVGLYRLVTYLLNLPDTSFDITQKLMLPSNLVLFIHQPWSIITYFFLHTEFLHILFNLLWLYWVGSILQEYLGNSKTYKVFFGGGIFGGFIFIFAFNIFPVFYDSVQMAHAMGASAGVLAIVVATATLLPDYPLMLLFFGNVKLKYIALVSIVLDLISIPSSNAGGHIAHLGGAFFGYLFIKMMYSRSNFIVGINKYFSELSANLRPGKSSNLKIHYKSQRIKIEERDKNKPSQEEIDKILDKISKNGYESLSKTEKDALFNASKE